MCAGFKAGSADAHRLINETSDDVVYLEVGDQETDDQLSHPNDDLKALQVDGRRTFSRKNGTPLA